jgi:hypothetical protein
MRTAADCILRLLENEKEFIVKSAAVQNTIGLDQNGSGNVLNVVLEQPCGVERSWSLLSYHFTNGICVWRL